MIIIATISILPIILIIILSQVWVDHEFERDWNYCEVSEEQNQNIG